MNQLVESLVKPFLTEDQAEGKEVIAVVPGGYKPPTLGHYYLVDQVSKKPEVDKTLVLIGHKERDGITKEDALDIWNIYENHLTGDIDIRISDDVSPIKELFSLIGDNPDKYFVLVVGVRSEEDLKDVKRFDNLKKKFDNLEVVQVKGEDAIRGTNARKAVLDKDFIDFNRYLPVELSDTERDQIWNILTRETETLNEVGEASITPYKWEQEYTDNVTTVVSFETESGLEYNVELERDVYEGIPILEVEFVAGMVDPDTGGTMSSKTITNKGELFRVMSTIVDIIKHYVNKTEAQGVTYSPSKKGDETISTNQRNTLYKAFLKKQVPGVEFKQDSDYVVALFPGYEQLNEEVNFNALEKVLDEMFDDLDIDINFTKHFKERVLERGLEEEDVIELMSKIHDKYGDEVADMPKDSNRVFTHLTRLVDISSAMGSYGYDGLRDLYLTTAYKRKDKNEPEFRTNRTSPKLKVAESYKGKRTKDGAPGTLKAKISKLYGGDVTIEKARKLKNRKNATAHDKRQANWFINFHSKNESANANQLAGLEIDGDKVYQFLTKVFGEKSTDINFRTVADQDFNFKGNIPLDYFIISYAKLDHYFGEPEDNRLLGAPMLKVILKRIGKVPEDVIETAVNYFENYKNQLEKQEWFEQGEENKEEEYNPITGLEFDDMQDNYDDVVDYLKKNSNYLQMYVRESKTLNEQKEGVKFKRPKLKYSYVSLQPYVDKATMEEHFDKHFKGYTDKLNQELDEKNIRVDAENQIQAIQKILGKYPKNNKIRNNGGGFYNHVLYFENMTPDYKAPSTKFKKLLEDNFNSVSEFKEKFKEAGLRQFGSGWVFLIQKGNKLVIESYANQDNPYLDKDFKGTILIAMDVWEHAYYLKHKSKRGDYIDDFFKVVDYKVAEERLQEETLNENIDPEAQAKHKGKSSPYGSAYKPVNEQIEETLMPYIASLTKYMVKNGLAIDDAPEVHFVDDPNNAENIFGRTAFYDPNEKSITLYVTGRHPKDILRSFAHEMIHYCQDCENRLHHTRTTDVNEDDRLKELEREAYERGNMYFRSWENSLNEDDRKGIKAYSLELMKDLEEVMTESKSRYHVAVSELVRDIFLTWKEDYEGGEDVLNYFDDEYSFIDKTGREIVFDIDANLEVTDEGIYAVEEPTGVDPFPHKKKNKNQRVNPSKLPTFDINMKVDMNDLPKYWPKIYYDLVDIVRHEIEHLTHFGKTAIKQKELEDDEILRALIDANFLPKSDYYRLPAEVDAMLQGMAMKARKKKEPFAKTLNDYLNLKIDDDTINQEEKEDILNLWRKRAPSLSLPKF
jgi:Fe-Mn family superoxide dismutase